MKHGFLINGEELDTGLSRSEHGYRLHRGTDVFDFTLKPGETDAWLLQLESHNADKLHVAVDGDDVHIHLNGETYQLRFEHALQRLAQLSGASAADTIKASMPGSLISLNVAAGDAVKTGQTLLVMESMKMETTIVAPRDGIVAEVLVVAGQTFDKDALLLSLEPEADE